MEHHLENIDGVLLRLQKKGFQDDLGKSFFMQEEVKHVGFSLTKDGLTPTKEGQSCVENETTNPSLQTQNVFGNDQLPQGHVASPVSHLSPPQQACGCQI